MDHEITEMFAALETLMADIPSASVKKSVPAITESPFLPFQTMLVLMHVQTVDLPVLWSAQPNVAGRA